MQKFLTYLQRLALVFWLGQMLFFIVIFAPRVFRVLPRVQAGQLQAAIFPPYYLAGIVCAVVLLVATLLRGPGARHSALDLTLGAGLEPHAISHAATWRRILPLALIAVAGLVFVYAYLVLTPQITALQPTVLELPKDSDHPAVIAFRELHRLSVQLNGAALLALLVLLALL